MGEYITRVREILQDYIIETSVQPKRYTLNIDTLAEDIVTSLEEVVLRARIEELNRVELPDDKKITWMMFGKETISLIVTRLKTLELKLRQLG